MLLEEGLQLFRLVVRLLLPFIPVETLRSELTAEDIRRAKAMKEAADLAKFGP